ncbi:L-proline glycine betaine ABC transport system permease protein ProV [Candidatus Burkholderia verschuerenii]|uniref:Quaternary amine transport ATP-binding protein n=1 Tax=Candidatus Burkholderia verschuerenii TaxID=242163 RepID=A0A0L0MGT5_9BURK|nr:ABC transporter ATP-binding protein [Candidatus Burkholderia verschuerenii]KND61533.1 L-proline glycine betaine ABC transport system permease protein ProV [Candidatus Burkholderia verschuerenii]
MIELDRLTKTFTQKDGQKVNAVDSVSLKVDEGEICVFLGPSGCGKTTTLKMINRLIEPTSGRVLINGEDTSGLNEVDLRRHIGYVIQQIGLFSNMTIEENITVVPRLLGWDKKRCAERATELMSMVALDPKLYLKRYPKELSGGQQQRIGVIRALAADPPVLLMDEPFGAVDPINRETIQNEFFAMQRQLKKTVIMVSHDIDEAIKLGDRVAVFRRGKLVQYDHPDMLLAHPRDEFVGQFVGADSTLKRLLLVKAGDAALQPETALADTPLQNAYASMDEHDNRHMTVLDGEHRALGFVSRRMARGAPGVCADKVTQFQTTVSPEDNLRIVLSKMYQYSSSWMPVLDADGHYVGEVTQDSIAEYLSSGRSRQQTGQIPAARAKEAAGA